MAYLTLVGVIFFAAVVSFLVGWLWYSPVLFGKIWMKEMGITKEMAEKGKKRMMKVMGWGILLDILKAFCLLLLSVGLGSSQFFVGFLIWLGFILTMLFQGVIYEKRSINVTMISAGYQLVTILAMGLVFHLV